MTIEPEPTGGDAGPARVERPRKPAHAVGGAASRRLPFVVFNSDIPRLESDLARSVGPARTGAAIALAWQLRQRDPAGAEAHVREARAGLAHLESRASQAGAVRLALVEAEIHWLFSRVDECRHGLDDALRDAERLGDRVLLADAHWLGANLAQELADTAARDRAVTLCAACARDAGDIQREMFAKAASARWLVYADPVVAREIWSPVFASDEGVPPPPGVTTWIHDFHATLAFTTADYGRSLLYRLRTHNDAMATGQLKRVLVARSNISVTFRNLNHFDAAFEWGERCLTDARRLGWPSAIAVGLTHMGLNLAAMRRFDAARDVLLEALELPALAGVTRERCAALDYLAHCFENLNDPARALGLLEEMASVATALQQPDQVLKARMGIGRVTAASGQVDRAIELIRGLLEPSRQFDRSREIEVLSNLSVLHGRRRDEAGADGGSADGRAALACIEQAIALARSIDGYEVEDGVYARLAEEQGRAGDYRAAYETSLRATRAREKTLSKEAVNRSIAMQIAHETERARVDAEHHRTLTGTLQQTNTTLQRLGDIGREITRHLDERAVYEVLRSQVDGLLDGPHLAIYLLRDDAAGERPAPTQAGALSLAFGIVDGAAPVARPVPIALDDPVSAIALCAREGREIVRNADDPAADGDRPDAGAPASGSALYAPLEIGGRLLGVMALHAVAPQAYGERERLIVRTLCAYGAIGIDNARAYRRLSVTSQALQEARDVLARTNVELERAWRHQQQASLTDPLTGLRNRRFLAERMDEDVARTLRRLEASPDAPTGQPLVFFMIDVDHFKSVNDLHGHVAGDQVLMQMAGRLGEVLREGDDLVRWGGEEFLVVARDMSAEQGAVLAERLRQAAACRPFGIGEGESLHRTCSIGFAAYPFDRDARRLGSWPAMVELADHALYRAKQAGRDRWVGLCAREPAPTRERFDQLSRDPAAALDIGALALMQGAEGERGA